MSFTLQDFKQGLDELYQDLSNSSRNTNDETQELILNSIIFYRKKIKELELVK